VQETIALNRTKLRCLLGPHLLSTLVGWMEMVVVDDLIYFFQDIFFFSLPRFVKNKI